MTRRRKELRQPPSPARRPARRQVKSRFLIVCEGKTERGYFEQLRQLLRGDLVRVVVAPDCGRDPKRLVEQAIKRRRKADADARRQRDDNLRYEQVWCVFDVDDHARLPDACRQAEGNGILTAISNPCFELWALLHFREQRAHIEVRAAERALRVHLPDYDKRLDCATLGPRYETAVDRARWLDRHHERNGAPGSNPSTGVWRLTEAIWGEAHRPKGEPGPH